MRARRGMTLVELLVSLALVGMMAALAAVMWGQLRTWGEASSAAEAALRPQRAVMLLERQWSARAAFSGEDETLGRVVASAGELRFATRRAALAPGWPIVEAAFRVERDEEGAVALVYEEARLGPMGERLSVEPEGRTVALGELSSASWRFRVRIEGGDDAESVETVVWTEDPEALTLRETELLAVEFVGETERGEAAAWVGVVEPLR